MYKNTVIFLSFTILFFVSSLKAQTTDVSTSPDTNQIAVDNSDDQETNRSNRQISPESIIFQKYRKGVFTVYGESGRGSGFLIDSSGIILTNQHVIDNSSQVRVLLNDTTKIAGKILFEDKSKDIAVILVDPGTIRNLPPLKIAAEREEIVVTGERVLAIGSPLNQNDILTAGIVSKIKEAIIFSDVSLNPGNSGGPLINLDEEVIGINTIVGESESGPGISGSILISQAFELIKQAKILADSTEPPPADLLPTMPRESFPFWALKYAASCEKWDLGPYFETGLDSKSKFRVYLYTPPIQYRMQKLYELALAEKHRKRNKPGDSEAEEQGDSDNDLRVYYQDLGMYPPIVVFEVIPVIGATSGSLFKEMLAGMLTGISGNSGVSKYEFKSDLKEFSLYRNNNEVIDIEHEIQFIYFDRDFTGGLGSNRSKDMANAGVFVFSPDIFSPDEGAWPEIKLTITSAEKPDAPEIIILSRRTMERIWLDFEPCREMLEAENIEPLDLD